MSTPSFANKTVLITGGCGGLGLAISTAFLHAGANVVACDINADLVSTFSSSISTPHRASGDSPSPTLSPSNILATTCDITSPPALDALFAAAISRFGRIDIVVNNAGILDRFDPVGTLDEALWDRVIAVNLTAVMTVCKRAVTHMLERGGGGGIVNVASVGGLRGFSAGESFLAAVL